MMQDQTPKPAPKSRLMSTYVAVWAGLAGLAALYVGVLALRPDILAQYLPGNPETAEPQSNAGQRAEADVMAEVQSLKATVGSLRDDVSRLETNVSAQMDLSKGWETRIAALESKSDTEVAAADGKDAANDKKATSPMKTVADLPVAKPKPEAKAATTTVEKTATKTTSTPAPKPTVTKPVASEATSAASAKISEMKVINAAKEAAAKLETGSIDGSAEKVTFGPAIVSSSPKPVGVVIARGPSVDSLRLSWSLLSDSHAASLGSMQPRYTAGIDDTGLNYELVAGPVGSVDEAKKICKDLAVNAVSCRVGDYTGQAL